MVIWGVSLSFPRILWVREGQKILGNFEVFLDKNQKTKEKKDREEPGIIGLKLANSRLRIDNSRLGLANSRLTLANAPVLVSREICRFRGKQRREKMPHPTQVQFWGAVLL